MDKKYKDSFIEVKKIINESDPINLLNQGAPKDEYEGEVQKIISGLNACQNIRELQSLLYSIFKESFGENSAGNIELYLKPAEKIFKLK